MDRLKQEQERIDQEIKLFMKENERAFSEKYRVSWGNVNSMRLDTQLLKKEKPEIYHAYTKESAARKFVVKAA